MHKLWIVLAGALAACAPPTSAPASSGPVRTTTSVTTGSGGNVDIVSYAQTHASSHVLQATPEQVWAVLPAVYEQLKITPATIDPTARLIGNRKVVVNGRIGGSRASEFLDCGSTIGGAAADSYRVDLSVLTDVQLGAAGTSELRTTLQASATQRGVSGAPVRCGSSGRLEERIASLARLQLAAQ